MITIASARQAERLFFSCTLSIISLAMSAYGSISTPNRPNAPLPSTLWHTKKKPTEPSAPHYLTIHHLTLETASALPGLIAYLHKTFADELEKGLTYPQEILQGESYTQAMFEGYFFAADALVAISGEGEIPEGAADGSRTKISIAEASRGRPWEYAVAGVYYPEVGVCSAHSLKKL
ncbi:hypothetical protein BC629DRAFT_450002 [Irpex lacteus]|nr:hypothetical protein BC629DRAFT_450002 [Irpex lacteus]